MAAPVWVLDDGRSPDAPSYLLPAFPDTAYVFRGTTVANSWVREGRLTPTTSLSGECWSGPRGIYMYWA